MRRCPGWAVDELLKSPLCENFNFSGPDVDRLVRKKKKKKKTKRGR